MPFLRYPSSLISNTKSEVRPHSQDGFFLLEPLESRIAPATVWNAGPTAFGGQVNYTSPGDTPFVLASSSEAQDSIEALFAGSTDHYYLELGAKDVLNVVKDGGASTTLITLNAGRAIAFFYDVNNDGIVQLNEFSGLSLSPGADIRIGDSVNGDVLVNLDANGVFSTNSLTNDAKGIKNIFVSGSVGGSILSGGVISKANIGQGVEIIGTGTASNNYSYDLGLGTGFGDATLGTFIPAAKKAAPGISNVTAGKVDSITASDGGDGGAGGAIANVTLINDVDGLIIQAGNGGAGTASAANGGAGGKVSNVVIYGAIDDVANSAITISGGQGGAGTGAGKGGIGGSADKIYVGYEYNQGKLGKSPNLLSDYVYVNGGAGGSGKTGGAGGSLTNVNVRVQPPDTAPMGAEIGLAAGDGGSTAVAGGKSGNGGSVTNYFVVSNYDGSVDPLAAVAVTGGDAGDATAGATAGIGGSVNTGVVLAKVLSVNAGDGANATKTGGSGGSINNLQIAYPGDIKLAQFGEPESNTGNIFIQQLTLTAGNGGNGTASGKGGNGGSITGITAPDTDLSVLGITGGNGGSGTNGTGGNGGALKNILFQSDRDSANEVAAVIASGIGGSGDKKAGNGGDITGSSLLLSDASLAVTTGTGGASSAGAGGNGGKVDSLSLMVFGLVSSAPGTVTLTSGDGGSVAAGKGKAGNGGALNKVTAVAWGDVTVTSGNGGSADTGISGNGGSITGAVLISDDPTFTYASVSTRDYDSDEPVDPGVNPTDYVQTTAPTPPTTGSAILTAGSGGGGTAPAKGGNGGAIANASVAGLLNVAAIAGDGAFGGSGGDIKSTTVLGSGFEQNTTFQTFHTVSGVTTVDSFTESFQFAPFGDVTVSAGDGSTGAKSGGKGGGLAGITSYSSFLGGSTLFTAGDGGNSTGAGGAGGSISSLTLLGGSSEFSVLAGQGGNSTVKGTGGAGGGVNVVSVQFNAANIMLRDLAAGDGGDSATGKGGLGGSVSNVNTPGDIGVRFGAAYGLGAMGGIFAGAGGDGATDGNAGNVLNVTASTIAAIVAGREASPQLVSKVEGIDLAGFNELISDQSNGSFSFTSPVDPFSGETTNVNLAKYIGGISGDPTMANADQFKTTTGTFTAPVTPWTPGTVPLDGLVAAIVFNGNQNNVKANAWLQPVSPGSSNWQLVSAFNT